MLCAATQGARRTGGVGAVPPPLPARGGGRAGNGHYEGQCRYAGPAGGGTRTPRCLAAGAATPTTDTRQCRSRTGRPFASCFAIETCQNLSITGRDPGPRPSSVWDQQDLVCALPFHCGLGRWPGKAGGRRGPCLAPPSRHGSATQRCAVDRAVQARYPVTVMPLIFGFSVPEMNWITTWPLLLAVVVNVRAMALFWPPAAA